MHIQRTFRDSLCAAAIAAALLVGAPLRARAESKEMVQLQTQVQQLLDMVQRLQTTVDTRFAVLQNLAQQTADEATRMNGTVNTLQQKLNQQNEALSGKLDTSSGQVQSLNDSVDELKTRIAKLEKTIQDLQGQLQNIQTAPASSTPSAMPGTVPGPGASAAPPPPFPSSSAPGPGSRSTPGVGARPAPAASAAPPLQQTYEAAVSDFNAAKYQLAASEFSDIIQFYPMDPMAGSAQYYLGEIAYRQHNYDEAVRAYTSVLEQFAGSTKAPAAQLHKGLALIDSNRRDAGLHELRSLIQRHPQTPEAAQARAKLNGMGVRIAATPR